MNDSDAYRILAALALAAAFPATLTAAEIARRRSIPEKFLARLLAALAHRGVVVTARGPRGGARLARPAERITLAEVLDPEQDHDDGRPAILTVRTRLSQARRQVLESLTLNDLANMEREGSGAFAYEI